MCNLVCIVLVDWEVCKLLAVAFNLTSVKTVLILK